VACGGTAHALELTEEGGVNGVGLSASVSTAEREKGLNGGSGGQQQCSGSMNAPARSRVGAKAEHGGHAAFGSCARSAQPSVSVFELDA
jgi:hypothetical protein